MAKNYSKKKVMAACKKSNGVMEYVARELGCGWLTARRYVDKWPETKEAFDQAEVKLHAVAYQRFEEAVGRGERWAVERILDTSARRNGHGTVSKHEIDHMSSDGSLALPTQIIVQAPDEPESDD